MALLRVLLRGERLARRSFIGADISLLALADARLGCNGGIIGPSCQYSREFLRNIFREKVTFAVDSSDCNSNNSMSPSISTDLSPKSVCDALLCYNNDWKRALEFFDSVETECHFEHTTETYNRMIDILGKFFEFELCWGLIHRMKQNPLTFPNHEIFRTMFKRYACAHLVEEVMSTYEKLDEYNLKDEMSYYNLVDALCERKHVIEANEFCMGKKQQVDLGFHVDNTKIHNMILRGWYKMGWWSKCREFWEEMDKKGVKKDLHSYSIYMDIVSKSGKPWKAVKLYKEMKRRRMKLDVVAYNTVISAVGLSQGVDFSLRLYREMKEFGCEPNVVTYNTIIKLLCQTGRVAEAILLLDQMYKNGCKPNVITYHCIFGYLEKPREILRLFDRMIASGVYPSMDTYVLLIRKFGRWGFLRPIMLIWEKMEEMGASPDEFAYNALIDALVEKGLIDLAQKYDEEMLSKGLSAKPRAELATKPELECFHNRLCILLFQGNVSTGIF